MGDGDKWGGCAVLGWGMRGVRLGEAFGGGCAEFGRALVLNGGSAGEGFGLVMSLVPTRLVVVYVSA